MFINKGVSLLVRGRNVLISGDLFIKKGTNCINKGGMLLIRFLLIGAGCLINKGTNCIHKGRRFINKGTNLMNDEFLPSFFQDRRSFIIV